MAFVSAPVGLSVRTPRSCVYKRCHGRLWMSSTVEESVSTKPHTQSLLFLSPRSGGKSLGLLCVGSIRSFSVDCTKNMQIQKKLFSSLPSVKAISNVCSRCLLRYFVFPSREGVRHLAM